MVGERKVADRRIDIIKKSGTYFLYSELDEDVILYDFLQAWDSSQDIKECLLPEVISVLSGDVEFTDIGADIFGVAYIKPQVTKLIGVWLLTWNCQRWNLKSWSSSGLLFWSFMVDRFK